MYVRFSPPTGEIEVTGNRGEFFYLALGLHRGGAHVTAANGGSPEPYERFLSAILVRNVPAQRVQLSVTCEGALLIEGDLTMLRILAANLEALGESGDQAGHLHVEYFPGHFYLSEGSLPAVFAID